MNSAQQTTSLEALAILGRRGCVTFNSQADAESYLMALPEGFNGRTMKSESGKWMVSYHWSAK